MVVSSRKQDAVDVVAESIRAARGETVARDGGVDVVVNNAAANPVFGPVADQGAAGLSSRPALGMTTCFAATTGCCAR